MSISNQYEKFLEFKRNRKHYSFAERQILISGFERDYYKWKRKRQRRASPVVAS